MMIDEARFFAWLDGELAHDEAAEVALLVAADPVLQRKADEHRRLAAGLRAAFAPAAEAPLPRGIADLLGAHTAAPVASLAEARERRESRFARPLWKQMAAMAATLALGVFAGQQLGGDGVGPVRVDDGRLLAAAPLEGALDTRLASAPAKDGPRIGLSFRDRSGAMCRTFGDRAASGLACRDAGEWRIVALVDAADARATDYRMAAGPDPALMALVDERMAGDPLDAAQERAARNQGWR